MYSFTNSAIIPLYLNNDMVNNLFTIVVQEFAEHRSINNRSTKAIKITTPLSNVTCGKYVQGTFNIDFFDEFSKTEAEEIISKEIRVFLGMIDILVKENLLKNLNTKQDISKIQEKNFVQFSCELKKDPLIEYMENIVNVMEMQLAFEPYNKENDDINDDKMKKEIIALLKRKMSQHKQERCLNFIADGICNTKTKIIVPLEVNCLKDNIDYIANSKVSVIGKVVKITDEKSTNKKNMDIMRSTCFEYLNQQHLNEFKKRFLKDTSLIKGLRNMEIADGNDPVIEIVPIIVYI
ncbi:hypothetical protein OW763_03495 [Clostridium aestuarii]|uniref:Uncharacterized protein n=1 Tax=Clostridium aestuarii TaxID=338193 RepID=A0ABT4CWS5_9CLOT|nr:hypothetical protein [Clostridium aestuarii]MCY6483421.1 hypothetical protein [Clostridium aestuarii]